MKTLFLSIVISTALHQIQGNSINIAFEKINNVTTKYNSIAAEIAWESSLNPGNPELPDKAANYQRQRILWEGKTCEQLVALENRQMLNNTQMRQTYLMCRGPKFTYDEARKTSVLYEELQSIYSDAQVCLPYTIKTKNNLTEVEETISKYIAMVKQVLKTNEKESVSAAAKLAVDEKVDDNFICLRGESDFQKIMKYSRNEDVLKWVWLVWREKVGPPMKEPYRNLVNLENKAARRNGYADIGAAWRDELEIPELRRTCRHLYNKMKPLYTILHGVVRYYLRQYYGDIVPEKGPIPAHLLGNLWSQNWEPIAELIVPQTIDLDKSIRNLNWTTTRIVKLAEDFYLSLGLPAMTDTFWRESVFERETGDTRCHGTAADMFKNGDYRLLYCSETSAEDLYVIHHEMGHIQYYMAYEKQPGIFRQANSALHETIGDTIMYGVMSPQHLQRLGLINDSILFMDGRHNSKRTLNPEDENSKSDRSSKYEDSSFTIDEVFILKQALNKLPQIPFALLIEEYRWKYFEGGITGGLNEEFWRMARDLQGIQPPEVRGEEYFDVGAKFHVPDNTPFIRYFLSSFLQHQLFESVCKAAVYGRLHVKEDLPDSIRMNRCDFYGSRSAGKLLKDVMSRGHSQNWREILQATTGNTDISAAALERYYRPLYKLLARLVRAHRIPIGW